jgi:thioredoxin 1
MMKRCLPLLLLGVLLTYPTLLVAKESTIITLNQSNYTKTLQADEKLTIVKFWAPWCRACRVMNPEFKSASNALGDRVTFASVNVDKEPHIASKYQIHALPTTILFKGETILSKSIGSLDQEEIKTLITKHL